jgi:outer membrane protein TolC
MNDHRRTVLLVVLGLCWLLTGTAAFGREPESLTLKRAVALALQNSSELALARARYAVAEQQEAQARAPFRPNLLTGSGAAYTHGFPMTPGGAAPAVFDLSYVQTLFNPPLRAQAQAAARRVEVERLGLERGRDAVILRIAVVFLDLVQVRHAFAVRGGVRDAVQRAQNITRSRVAEGRELPVEAVRAELAGARAEQRIIELEGREQTLAAELRALTGLRSDEPFEIAPESLPAQPEQPAEQLVALALASNAELQQGDFERRARADRLKGERGGYWPSIDLVGEYAILSRINNYDEFFRRFQRHNLNVGIQARWSLFSAQTTSAVRLARSELRQSEVELRRKREEIELAVRRESQRTRELKAIRKVAGLELRVAQEDLRTLQERFQEERANLRDVENARLAESDKWVAFLQADYESQHAELELLKTTGQLGRLLL